MSNENNTKHTPGPWRAEAHGEDYRVVSENYGTIVQRYCYPNKRVDVYVEADARLMAASPDLLAACKEAAETIGALEGGCYPVLNMLMDAIDKAEEVCE